MAYLFRSIFFIGAIYAVSPVKTDTSDMMTLAGNARSTGAALAQTSSELARLTGESAEIALQAARSWAALDETSRTELRRLIGEMIASGVAPTGAVAPRPDRAPTRIASERQRS